MPMPVVRGQRRTTRRDLSQIEAIQALQIIDGTLFRFGMPLALIGCESTVPAWEATTSPPSSEEARCGASPPRTARHRTLRFAFAMARREKANPRSSLRGRARGSASEELYFWSASCVGNMRSGSASGSTAGCGNRVCLPFRAGRFVRRASLTYCGAMKHAQQILRHSASPTRRLPVEEPPPSPPDSPIGLPRLALGGAICGGFAGSFAGAVLGMAVGIVYRDISLGLDGALLGGIIAAAGGAAYGLILAVRERRDTLSSGDETHPFHGEKKSAEG